MTSSKDTVTSIKRSVKAQEQKGIREPDDGRIETPESEKKKSPKAEET